MQILTFHLFLLILINSCNFSHSYFKTIIKNDINVYVQAFALHLNHPVPLWALHIFMHQVHQMELFNDIFRHEAIWEWGRGGMEQFMPQRTERSNTNASGQELQEQAPVTQLLRLGPTSSYLSRYLLHSGSCTVESSEAEEMTAVSNRQIWIAYVARSILSQRATSGSLALPQLRSVLMSMALVINEGQIGNHGLCQHLRPGSLMAILLLGPC